jgi:hypothetical protein
MVCDLPWRCLGGVEDVEGEVGEGEEEEEQPGGLFYAKDVGSGRSHVHDRLVMLAICVVWGLRNGRTATAVGWEARVENTKLCHSSGCWANKAVGNRSRSKNVQSRRGPGAGGGCLASAVPRTNFRGAEFSTSQAVFLGAVKTRLLIGAIAVLVRSNDG